MESSSCFSAQSRQWLAFLDESLLEELTKPPPILLFPQEQQQQQQQQHSSLSCSSFRSEVKPLGNQDRCSRKRSREEHCSAACSKAIREKIRRDKLNDKFLELSSALDPGRPVKTDKSIILSEATSVVQQLRLEAKQLIDSNAKLRDALKDLKAEKNDLRDEKVRLKLEKERLEEQLKNFSIPLMSHPAAAFQAAALLASHNPQLQAVSKADPGPPQGSSFPGIAMWRFMTPTTTDTSQDPLLRPPVA